jgi:hypothetical protein
MSGNVVMGTVVMITSLQFNNHIIAIAGGEHSIAI